MGHLPRPPVEPPTASRAPSRRRACWMESFRSRAVEIGRRGRALPPLGGAEPETRDTLWSHRTRFTCLRTAWARMCVRVGYQPVRCPSVNARASLEFCLSTRCCVCVCVCVCACVCACVCFGSTIVCESVPRTCSCGVGRHRLVHLWQQLGRRPEQRLLHVLAKRNDTGYEAGPQHRELLHTHTRA